MRSSFAYSRLAAKRFEAPPCSFVLRRLDRFIVGSHGVATCDANLGSALTIRTSYFLAVPFTAPERSHGARACAKHRSNDMRDLCHLQRLLASGLFNQSPLPFRAELGRHACTMAGSGLNAHALCTGVLSNGKFARGLATLPT